MYGAIWKSNKPKMHQLEEVSLSTDWLIPKHQSTSRLLQELCKFTLPVSFDPLVSLGRNSYLTTNLHTLKGEKFSPAYA